MTFAKFFFGTPQRLLATIAAMVLVFGLFRPDLVQQALYNLLFAIVNAVAPFLEFIFITGLMLLVLKWIFKGWKK